MNHVGIWKNWSGYLVAPNYQHSILTEYYAIRNAAAIFDTSPLFKYRIIGEHSSALLSYVLARNIGDCKTGMAQYSVMCDERGFVVQDCVVLHVEEDEFWMTTADPALWYLEQTARHLNLQHVRIEDVSDDYGILAVQGLHAANVLGQLTDGIDQLQYFGVTKANIAGKPVVISRTGYTGDLGYEIWSATEHCIELWNLLFSVGSGFNLTPIGTTALKIARLEAGLLLMGVDFYSSRYAWVDDQRDTPLELGWGWMFKKLNGDPREFRGKAALLLETVEKSNRWKTVGLVTDWHDYERLHRETGIPTNKHEVYREATMSIYRRGSANWEYAGYASSFAFSPLLQKPIAIAKLPNDLARPGTEVDLEISILRRPANVLVRVASLPFFNPPRKTTTPSGVNLNVR